jgi:hypothetical protein
LHDEPKPEAASCIGIRLKQLVSCPAAERERIRQVEKLLDPVNQNVDSVKRS